MLQAHFDVSHALSLLREAAEPHSVPRVKLTATWGQFPRAEPCQGVQAACRSLRLRAKSALAHSRPLVSTSTCWVTGPWASTEIKGTLAFLGHSWSRSGRGMSVSCRSLPFSAHSKEGERPPPCTRFSDHTLCFCSWGTQASYRHPEHKPRASGHSREAQVQAQAASGQQDTSQPSPERTQVHTAARADTEKGGSPIRRSCCVELCSLKILMLDPLPLAWQNVALFRQCHCRCDLFR